jgi:hypothetical protein
MHRTIEMLIGRLITDEAFRADFLRQPEATLLRLRERGLELTPTEIAALVATDPALWTHAADVLDPRLQKVGFQNEARTR